MRPCWRGRRQRRCARAAAVLDELHRASSRCGPTGAALDGARARRVRDRVTARPTPTAGGRKGRTTRRTPVYEDCAAISISRSVGPYSMARRTRSGVLTQRARFSYEMASRYRRRSPIYRRLRAVPRRPDSGASRSSGKKLKDEGENLQIGRKKEERGSIYPGRGESERKTTWEEVIEVDNEESRGREVQRQHSRNGRQKRSTGRSPHRDGVAGGPSIFTGRDDRRDGANAIARAITHSRRRAAPPASTPFARPSAVCHF